MGKARSIRLWRKEVTRKAVEALLRAEDYAGARAIGPRSLPYLRSIVEGDDWHLAAKAVHVAGLLNLDESLPIIELAARSRQTVLRVAAAAAAASLAPHRGEQVLKRLLKSRDVGIRKWAIRSAGAAGTESLRATLDGIRRGDPSDGLRSLASRTLTKRTHRS